MGERANPKVHDQQVAKPKADGRRHQPRRGRHPIQQEGPRVPRQDVQSTPDCVIVYGMQTKFGGGSTSGFANIYDSLDYLKKNEVRFRQVRAGIAEKIEKKARAQRRQLKNRQKKVKGTAKSKD